MSEIRFKRAYGTRIRDLLTSSRASPLIAISSI